jgi:hypothetical protein
VYGHPGHGIAYIVPAKQIFQDIEKRFGSPISLPLTPPATFGHPKPLDTLKPQVIPVNTAPAFGTSLPDITIVVTFCGAVCLKCVDAGGEYGEVSTEILGLYTVLRHLKYEVEAPDSPLNSDRSIWGRQVAPIVGDAYSTLRQLDELLQLRSGVNAGWQWSLGEKLATLRFYTDKMAQLEAIRTEIISHTTSLTLFLDTIQLCRSRKITKISDSSNANRLDKILDTMDSIALKMGQKISQQSVDEKEMWKQFLEVLIAEGFSAQILARHKVSQLPASNIQTNAYTI